MVKVAVAYNKENGEIFEHFGHAEMFAVYEYGETVNDCTKTLLDCSDRHGHQAMADLMKENGIMAVLCGNMGAEAKSLLLSYAIVPIAGYCGDADTAADLLVVAGRGIGEKKNMDYVRRLAELLGGDYGVSRPLVDMGWAPYEHQVGQTGLSVSPKVLISLGVSGAIQHLAGIGGAETIIAVNTDPDAAIFGAAGYAYVGDCVEFAKAMIEKLEKDG